MAPLIVNVENFERAETDRMFADLQRDAGGVNRLDHAREPAQVEHQTVIRMNRDTLYSRHHDYPATPRRSLMWQIGDLCKFAEATISASRLRQSNLDRPGVLPRRSGGLPHSEDLLAHDTMRAVTTT